MTELEDQGKPRPFLWASCWTLSWISYVALAGTLGWAEAVAGGVSALLATWAIAASGNPEHLGRMRPGWWLILVRRLPGKVFTDSARLVGAVLTGNTRGGRFLYVPFDPGGDDTVSGSRRALVKAAASLAPNSYVVILDREHHLMLTHQLMPTDRAQEGGDRQWPI